MITGNLEDYRADDYITCKCDICGKEFIRLKRGVKSSRKKNEGQDRCVSCSAKVHPKPQCTKAYWENPEIKRKHSDKLKSREPFIRADISGSNNPMYGKHLSIETRAKMSMARKGKIGPNATAWKGGKTSLNNRVKLYIARSGWYKRVFERDGWVCQDCGSKKNLDGHHKKAISIIIKEALQNTNFQTDEEKYVYLISRPEIIDSNLENGITLCRKCHRKAHNQKWGNHDQ